MKQLLKQGLKSLGRAERGMLIFSGGTVTSTSEDFAWSIPTDHSFKSSFSKHGTV